jgi:hypothetical protein
LRFSGLILEKYFVVFLSSSCRETPKKTRQKQSKEKNERIFPQLFWQKVVDMGFWGGGVFVLFVCGVYLQRMLLSECSECVTRFSNPKDITRHSLLSRIPSSSAIRLLLVAKTIAAAGTGDR